jgi:hypothetical protein
MRVRAGGFLAAVAVAVVAGPGVAEACHKCGRTPCVMAPAPMPAVQCVTEMVPYTVNRMVTRTAYQEVTETIMVPEVNMTYVERQRVVCKPVFDRTTVPRTVTVCRPETTTQQVTEICMQPTTQLVTVPVVAHKCGHCGKTAPACGCATVAQTCYTPVPVVRDVQVTRMVPETRTVEVPLVTCRMVQEVVTDRIPIPNVRCVPKQVTRRIPYPVCEMVTETCYRPVTRMVPVTCAAPAYAAPQAAPTSQAAASAQG